MSAVLKFPDPWTAEVVEDIIAVGGNLSVKNLVLSYRMGIFPWPHEGYPMLWFCPEKRGVIDFSDLHLGRTLKKWIRKNDADLVIKFNENFEATILACQAQKRNGQKGTWISEEIVRHYLALNGAGEALSLECYRDGNLISGIYGVSSKHYFSCESMFFKEDNASKYVFVKLVDHLKKMGHDWMDLQMVTDVSGALGGKYISREDFLTRIEWPRPRARRGSGLL